MAFGTRQQAALNSSPDVYRSVVDFLNDPQTHGGAAVKHIETHVSHVFLAGDFAYKIKKAVRFEFVDFSTLEARRMACYREIDVNARTAPDIYLEVVAVNTGNGVLSLGPPSHPIEYAVKMHRFSQEGLFDRMAEEGRLTPRLLRGLADAAAGLHLSAGKFRSGAYVEDFEVTAIELLSRLRLAADDGDTSASVSTFALRIESELNNALAETRARQRHGAVRHVHGDLHLRNICTFRGHVRLFDAIEFEPKYSHIDILYDIAFALMDLLHRGQNGAAILVLSRYLSATRDYSGIDILRLFMTVRAGIRGLIALLGPSATGGAEARSYLDLGTHILDCPAPPRLIAVGGRSGTGKSTLAQALAPELAHAPDIVVIRADEVRKRMLGVAPETHLPRAAYTPEINARVYARLLKDAARVLENGATAVLDATFLRSDNRDALVELGSRLDVPVTGLWLFAPQDVLEDRLERRQGDASDADAAVLHHQPKDLNIGASWHLVNASGTQEATLSDALKLVLQN